VERARAAGAGIAFSYSEPSLALELTMEIAQAVRQEPVPIVWKTNGFLTRRACKAAAKCVSAANIDLKCRNSALHERLTGAPVEPVLETIREFVASGVWVEISTPVIPGISSDPDELASIADAVAGIDANIPWHVIRVSPEFRLSADRPTSVEEIERAVEIGQRAGLGYVYVERALGPSGRATRCRTCSSCVIERGIWSTERIEITSGRCPRCGAALPGRW
jgi:pyruvate formate lyase activating enzyme